MENKLVIAIATLMVVALAAPVVMADTVNYTATVKSGQNTAVTTGPGGLAFGDILTGNDKTLTDSLTLTNSGDWDATVSAAFITPISGPTYGLVGVTPSNVIPASNFELGIATPYVSLNDNGSPKDLTSANNVPAGAGNSVNYDAKLTVPGTQAVDSYTGTVELTFGNV